MTTEVLRNMIYAGSPGLDELAWVVLDEVHYLQDAYRGPVWEEVIIHAPPRVRLVCLSATVSNASRAGRLDRPHAGQLRGRGRDRAPGPPRAPVHGGRPARPTGSIVIPTLVDGRPNPEGRRFEATAAPAQRPQRSSGPAPAALRRPRRVDVVEELAERDLVPALYFIFSRAACDEAVSTCLTAGLRLTTPDERDRVRAIAEEHTRNLADADLDVLGYGRWLAGLEAGVAAHHAGMVPPFKEAVEACFAEGLVKVVFATETLALGRQHAGPHGRDREADQVQRRAPRVPQPGGVHAAHRAGRAAGHRPRRPRRGAVEPLRHLRRRGPAGGQPLLRPPLRLPAHLQHGRQPGAALRRGRRRPAAEPLLRPVPGRPLGGAARAAPAGPAGRSRAGSGATLPVPAEELADYRALRREAERPGTPDRRRARRAIETAVARLLPGTVIRLDHQRGEPGVVVSVGQRRGGGVRVKALTAEPAPGAGPPGGLRRAPRSAWARSSCPGPSRPTTGTSRTRCCAGWCGPGSTPRREAGRRRRRAGARVAAAAPDASCPTARRRRGRRRRRRRCRCGAPPRCGGGSSEHPLSADPVRAPTGSCCGPAHRIERAERDVADLSRRVDGVTDTVARRFGRLVDLLGRWGYLDGWR